MKSCIPLLSLGLVACGGQEFESLLRVESNDSIAYSCPSGEVVSFRKERNMSGSLTASPGIDIAESCRGIYESCPMEGAHPEDAACADPTLNRFAGTCVDMFFDCYRPTGTCNPVGQGHNWQSGHRALRDSHGQLIAPGADEPCVIFSTYNGSGPDDGIVFLKPL